MTPREVFDKVKAHMLEQNARALNHSTGRCVYRAPDGKRCAVGCLIADEHYSPDLEGGSCMRIGVRNALEASGVEFQDVRDMLATLQCVHDRKPPEEWPAHLALIERNYFGGAS